MTQSQETTAWVILTGDELLQGRVRDTNGPYLCSSLIERGFVVRRLSLVPDDHRAIRDAVAEALSAAPQVLVVSGGLGTTHDDLTMAAVADALGVKLQREAEAWQHVQRRVRELAQRRDLDGQELLDQSAKQALLPVGARCVAPAGQAPGAVVRRGDTTVVVLPGPPRELMAMWPGVLEDLPGSGRALQRLRILRIGDVGEMQVATVLRSAPSTGLDIGITAGDGEVVVRIAAWDAKGAAHADRLAEALTAALPVFSTDGRELDGLVADALREQSATVAVAESCTGGLLGGRLTTLAGSSDYFLGGILSYADEVKRDLLHVPADLLARHGAVSKHVAAAMAQGVRRAVGAQYGLATTGVAGPGGGSPQKPVGLVFIACAGPAGTRADRRSFPGDREAVRRQAVTAALHMLLDALRSA